MATLKTQSNSCITCGKTAGTFACPGCSKMFCSQHTNEHRQVLEEQMNKIVLNHDRLKRHLEIQTTKQHHRMLMQEIDRWEQQSIDKIKQTANAIRQQLVTIDREYTDNTTKEVTQLAQQLKKAQYDGNYFENDINQWTGILSKLRCTFLEQQNFRIQQIASITPFISEIFLAEKSNNDTEQSIQLLKSRTNYDESENDISLDTRNEYASDIYLFRFKFEEHLPNGQALIGIISRSSSKFPDPFKNPTLYGWGSNNLVYLHGVAHSNYNNYQSDIEEDDVFQLIIDFNRRLLRFTNERTHLTYELQVDILKCPLPWQFQIRLFNSLEGTI